MYILRTLSKNGFPDGQGTVATESKKFYSKVSCRYKSFSHFSCVSNEDTGNVRTTARQAT